MSVNPLYYDLEDSPEPAADQALANWRAHQRAMRDTAAAAAQRLKQLEYALGTLYAQAEQTRDEAALQHIMDAWGRAQQLYESIVKLDAAVAGAGETIKALNRQREELAAELDSLSAAIEICDTHDPRLADMAGQISDDAWESAYDVAVEEAEEVVYEHHFNTAYEVLSGYSLTRNHIAALLDLLAGEIALDPQQAEWLRMFCDSLPRHPEDAR